MILFLKDNFNDENLNEFIYVTKNGFISIIFIELVLSSFSDSVDNSIIVNVVS